MNEQEMAGFTFNGYQRLTAKTAVYPGQTTIKGILYCALGMSGEAGEVAGRVKKILRDDGLAPPAMADTISNERRINILRQMGDVLWYISQMASELGVPLTEVAEMNIKKLTSRQERGALHGQGDGR